MTEKHNDAPQKTLRFSKRRGKHIDGAGLDSNTGFPQLAEQLQRAAEGIREMELMPGSASLNLPEWSPGIRVRHKQHPEYGTGMIRTVISGGMSVYCSFDQFSLSAQSWTPSGYYRISQLEKVEEVDKSERTLI
ncbi:hypothetical protein J23TS9_00400 [Paenibacillus sp. J23TS9]|uniref:hypothetical protein n=1 Tax=Paenibacillus sp. J23TS9 TaxID=2807193 RepID=UPI001B06D5E1|nr:hypothetical protein [Paenibacillus sp. J23TS9]GIP24910.1 hypothetical protein J23TS9_00400 [Paenibacillus sp. J23TS9]